MGRAERDKGARGELEVAHLFREHGFDCERVPNSGGLRLKGDLYGDVPVHVEVKRQERLQVPAWLKQARAECGEATPVVVFRQSRNGWYAALPLEALLVMLRRLRCRYCGRVTDGVDVCGECLDVAINDPLRARAAVTKEDAWPT